MRKAVLYLALSLPFLALANLARADEAHDIVDRARSVLSAGADVRPLKSIQFAGQQINYDIVENDHIGPPYYASVSAIEQIEDYAGGQRYTATDPADANRRALLTGAKTISLAGPAAAPKRSVRRAPPSWETQEPLHALALAAAAPDLLKEPDVMWRGSRETVVSFSNGGYRVRLLINQANGLIEATEALVSFDQPLSGDVAWTAWGDVKERTEFMNWSMVDGVRYPYQIDLFRNDVLMRSTIISAAHLDQPFDAASFQTAEAPDPLRIDDLPLGHPVAGAPDPASPIAEIAPDIVQIPNSWFVTLVRQPDGIVILDAPISAGYSRAVLAEAERRFPGMPVKAVVTSTGFFWHVAGVREYAARNIPIYAESRNAGVINALLAAPHTLRPDDLSQRFDAAPVVRAVSEPVTIGSSANAVTIMPIAHATQPMLMTYIKDRRLLHTGEMVLPLGPGGALLNPESLIEISREVAARKITVERIIGMHMAPTPWSKVGEAIKSAGGSA